jgi:hypothetical protein
VILVVVGSSPISHPIRHPEKLQPNQIRQGRHDCSTERKGSPHVLVCTKNQASYERRVAQRRADLDDLTRLKA